MGGRFSLTNSIVWLVRLLCLEKRIVSTSSGSLREFTTLVHCAKDLSIDGDYKHFICIFSVKNYADNLLGKSRIKFILKIHPGLIKTHQHVLCLVN